KHPRVQVAIRASQRRVPAGRSHRLCARHELAQSRSPAHHVERSPQDAGRVPLDGAAVAPQLMADWAPNTAKLNTRYAASVEVMSPTSVMGFTSVTTIASQCAASAGAASNAKRELNPPGS